MKFQYRVSLLSIVAASSVSCMPFAYAEPITDMHISLEESVRATLESDGLLEAHDCSDSAEVCDSGTVESPAPNATVEDDILLTLADLFSVRFGFGPGQPSGPGLVLIDWAPAFRAEFDSLTMQPGRAAQIRREQNGFEF